MQNKNKNKQISCMDAVGINRQKNCVQWNEKGTCKTLQLKINWQIGCYRRRLISQNS